MRNRVVTSTSAIFQASDLETPFLAKYRATDRAGNVIPKAEWPVIMIGKYFRGRHGGGGGGLSGENGADSIRYSKRASFTTLNPFPISVFPTLA